MNKPIFTYNDPNASCTFCDRTQNPHPDYSDEPIVITRLKLHQGDQEVCINCYWDMVAVANASGGCCQTNENSHRIAGAALIYALNSWRHSVRAAVRLNLKLSRE